MSVERAGFEILRTADAAGSAAADRVNAGLQTPPAPEQEEAEDQSGTSRRPSPPPKSDNPTENATPPWKEEATGERPVEQIEQSERIGRGEPEEADGTVEGVRMEESGEPPVAADEPEIAAAAEPGAESDLRPGVDDPPSETARGSIGEAAATRATPAEVPRAEEPKATGWDADAARGAIEALVRRVVEQREKREPRKKEEHETAAGMAALAGMESRLRHLEERLRFNRDGG